MACRLLLVDDHHILRDGLRMLLGHEPEFDVVAEASTSDEAWEKVSAFHPDIVVMDLDLPGVGGIALTRRIRETYPDIKVVVLTAHAEEKLVSDALRVGASGYLLKRSAGSDLVTALKAALSGQVFLCPESSTVVVREYQRQQAGREGQLSSREIEILKRIADGQSTKEIAFALQLSPKTIETHRINMMEKLRLDSVAKLTKYAVREGLTTL
jgi:DNA-binding NarL/FixJ family response regulator